MSIKQYEIGTVAGRVIRSLVWVAGSVVFLYIANIYTTYVDRKEMERQSVICPSFLSISRSARDTLIVMRNEPLCNRYVLEGLR